MNKVISEFNQLYPKFKAQPFNTQCEIIETNARQYDFKRLVVKNINGYVFPLSLIHI